MKCLIFGFCFLFLFFVFDQRGPPEAGKKKCGDHEELGEGEELVVKQHQDDSTKYTKYNEKYKH